MSRKTSSRRYAPGEYCVSQIVVDEEARRVAREVDGLLLLAHAELRERVACLDASARQNWQTLLARLEAIEERHGLAIRRAFLRDLLLLTETYLALTRADAPIVDVSIPTAAPYQRPVPVKPFAEWLFPDI